MALSELLEQRCTQFDVRGDYTVVAGPFPRKDNRAEGHSLHPVVEKIFKRLRARGRSAYDPIAI